MCLSPGEIRARSAFLIPALTAPLPPVRAPEPGWSPSGGIPRPRGTRRSTSSMRTLPPGQVGATAHCGSIRRRATCSNERKSGRQQSARLRCRDRRLQSHSKRTAHRDGVWACGDRRRRFTNLRQVDFRGRMQALARTLRLRVSGSSRHNEGHGLQHS